MKVYRKTRNGGFFIEGKFIPDDERNPDHSRMISEVETGQAEIIPYETPTNELYAQCRNARDLYRLNNFIYNGIHLSADRNSQSDLTSLALLYQIGIKPEAETTKWKISSGNYYEISGKEECLSLADSMSSFVQKCFEAEAVVVSEIELNQMINIDDRFAELMSQ